MSTELTRTSQLLPSRLMEHAIAFPDKVDAFLKTQPTNKQLKDAIAQGKALQTLLDEIDAVQEQKNPVAYGLLKLKAEAGGRMKREKGGRGKKSPTPTVGLSNPNAISAYRKISDNRAKLPEYWEQYHLDEELSQAGFIARYCGGAHVSKNTGAYEWYTPLAYIVAAKEVMGDIDLDPASSEKAQETVGAKNFYTEDEDGLEQPWFGRVWLNPPYKARLVDKFMAKLKASIESEEVAEAISLTNNSTDTGWFQDCAETARAWCFPEGRVRFVDQNGVSGAPLQGQVILYFGENRRKFCDVFGQFGVTR